MPSPVARRTVDLSAYPDLVVIYLGMRVRAWAGFKRILGLGPQIQRAGEAWPAGLLHFDHNIIFGFRPFHVGMRWYWKDLASMDAWTRSEPHARWWRDFMKDSGGTGFWHETYFIRGGMEAIYDDVQGKPFGLLAFAPTLVPKGSTFAKYRQRDGVPDAPSDPPAAPR